MELKKVFFENTYTQFIEEKDVDFFYELLSLFYDYNEGLIEDKEDLDTIQYILKELEFVRSVPKQLEEELKVTENMTQEEYFSNVKSVIETMIETTFEHDNTSSLMDGLSARIALGLGLKYEEEIKETENIIEITYDKEDDSLEFSNFLLQGEQEE